MLLPSADLSAHSVCVVCLFLSQPGGDASELFSCCGDEETARTVRLLKSPETAVGVAPDAFNDKRPILAVVKRGRYSRSKNEKNTQVSRCCILGMLCLFKSGPVPLF